MPHLLTSLLVYDRDGAALQGRSRVNPPTGGDRGFFGMKLALANRVPFIFGMGFALAYTVPNKQKNFFKNAS